MDIIGIFCDYLEVVAWDFLMKDNVGISRELCLVKLDLQVQLMKMLLTKQKQLVAV